MGGGNVGEGLSGGKVILSKQHLGCPVHLEGAELLAASGQRQRRHRPIAGGHRGRTGLRPAAGLGQVGRQYGLAACVGKRMAPCRVASCNRPNAAIRSSLAVANIGL